MLPLIRFALAHLSFVLLLGMSSPAAQGKSTPISFQDSKELASPSIHLSAQLGLGVFDAFLTKNSFLMGPLYGYSLVPKIGVDVSVGSDLWLSVAALYENRTFRINQSGTLVRMSRNTLVIPVVIKYSLLPLVSLLGGLYTGIAVGDWIYDPASPAELADLHSMDAGPVLGVEVKYPFSYSEKDIWHIVSEVSYYWALTNQSRNPVEDFRYRVFHLMVGVSYGF